MLALLQHEPARVGGVVSALIALAVAFGLPLTPEQTGAVLALVAVLTGEAVRHQVTPASELYDDGPDTPEEMAALLDGETS